MNRTYTYRICGLRVRSDAPFSLPASPLAGGGRPDIEISVRPGRAGLARLYAERALRGHIKNGAGHPSIAVYDVPGGLLLDCHNTNRRVEFFVKADGSRIDCYPHEGSGREEIEVWLFGLVLSFLLQGRGIYALHAAAVERGGMALAFLGHNGRGKTTLALFFSRGGHALLADDVLPIARRKGRFFVLPASPTMNLWPQTLGELAGPDASASDGAKRRYAARDLGVRFRRTETPLGRLYLLAPLPPDACSGVEISPVPPARALVELLAHTRANSMIPASGQKELLNLYADLVSQVPVRKLAYPSGFQHLPAVYEAVVAESGREANSSPIQRGAHDPWSGAERSSPG